MDSIDTSPKAESLPDTKPSPAIFNPINPPQFSVMVVYDKQKIGQPLTMNIARPFAWLLRKFVKQNSPFVEIVSKDQQQTRSDDSTSTKISPPIEQAKTESPAALQPTPSKPPEKILAKEVSPPISLKVEPPKIAPTPQPVPPAPVIRISLSEWITKNRLSPIVFTPSTKKDGKSESDLLNVLKEHGCTSMDVLLKITPSELDKIWDHVQPAVGYRIAFENALENEDGSKFKRNTNLERSVSMAISMEEANAVQSLLQHKNDVATFIRQTRDEQTKFDESSNKLQTKMTKHFDELRVLVSEAKENAMKEFSTLDANARQDIEKSLEKLTKYALDLDKTQKEIEELFCESDLSKLSTREKRTCEKIKQSISQIDLKPFSSTNKSNRIDSVTTQTEAMIGGVTVNVMPSLRASKDVKVQSTVPRIPVRPEIQPPPPKEAKVEPVTNEVPKKGSPENVRVAANKKEETKVDDSKEEKIELKPEDVLPENAVQMPSREKESKIGAKIAEVAASIGETDSESPKDNKEVVENVKPKTASPRPKPSPLKK